MTNTENAQLVTTVEEQAARDMQQQTVKLNAFASAWDMENMPACIRGMSLLKRFADTSPAGFEMALRGGLDDPLQLKHPLCEKNVWWLDFIRHRVECPDCNEAF